ncbi:MAG: hypothetical protein L3J75_11610 [Methylococcaceae bacterium]|nr:hypothetical protein [Methylococcaceae bacterium]
MERKESTPLWVFLAFSSISTRKGALILIWSSFVFTLYCIPWSLFFADQVWVSKVFLIDDWSWLAMMVPVIVWYWLSLRWVDKNDTWED